MYVEDPDENSTPYDMGLELIDEHVDNQDQLVLMDVVEGRENDWNLPWCYIYYKRPLINSLIKDHIKKYFQRSVQLSHPIGKVNYELRKISKHISVGRLLINFGMDKSLDRINQLINLHGYDKLDEALEKVLSWAARNELSPRNQAEVEPTNPVRANIAAETAKGRV